MCILQVNTFDQWGGAELIARSLLGGIRARGMEAWLAVGVKRMHDPTVLTLSDLAPAGDRGWLGRVAASLPWVGRLRGMKRLQRLLQLLDDPAAAQDVWRGREDFAFPATWRLLDLPPHRPDLIHAHNLHGGYFDLRVLPWLCCQAPVLLTLHDAWLLSGHCSHSFDCLRWETGCGQCPDLTIYPAIRRDATAANWQRKRDIYAESRLWLATPSRWLLDRVTRSMLAPAVVEARVIPNGVDLAIFHPGDRRAARVALGLPQEAPILLFAASGIRKNRWKDYQTMRAAINHLAARKPEAPIHFLALGEEAPVERLGGATIHFVPFQREPAVVARYYQAADLYIHAARAEVWGLTITEALACGTPVVATAVGGIPEQVRDGETGLLTPLGDAQALAEAIASLLLDEPRRLAMAEAAVRDARARFSLPRMVDDYLAYYAEILTRWHADHPEESEHTDASPHSR